MSVNSLLKEYYNTPDQYSAAGGGYPAEAMMTNVHSQLHLGAGINAPMLDVATPCTFTPAVIVVTSIPAMYMQQNGKPTVMGMLIKDLLETHAKSVSGIDFGYTLNTESNANVGHDSQMFAVPTKTVRNQPSPSFVFTELTGNLIFNWARRWIWDIQHPDTNASMANMVNYPGTWTMSAYAASFMVIQFDPTMRPERIIDAAHYVNVFPTGTGDIGFAREIGTVRAQERTIPFTAIVQQNPYIKGLAVQIAKKLSLHSHNFDYNSPNRTEVDDPIFYHGLKGEIPRGGMGSKGYDVYPNYRADKEADVYKASADAYESVK